MDWVQDCIISTLNLHQPAACHAMALNGFSQIGLDQTSGEIFYNSHQAASAI